MSEPFNYDVFISHSSKDKSAVRELAKRLKADGLLVWFDEWVIRPGDMIGLKIEQGLEQSRTLVLVMSANAFASDWVTLERHTAIFRDPTNAKRRFIPLRLDDAEMKDILKQFAYVDWRQRSDEQYAKLLAECQAQRNTTEPPSYPPENIKDRPTKTQPADSLESKPKPQTPTYKDAGLRAASKLLINRYETNNRVTTFILKRFRAKGLPSDPGEAWRIYITQASREQLKEVVRLLDYYFDDPILDSDERLTSL